MIEGGELKEAGRWKQKEFWKQFGVDYVTFFYEGKDYVFLGRDGWSISPAMLGFEVYWQEAGGARTSDYLILGEWGGVWVMEWDKRKLMFFKTDVSVRDLDKQLSRQTGRWVGRGGAMTWIFNPATGERSEEFHNIWMDRAGILWGEVGAVKKKFKIPWEEKELTVRPAGVEFDNLSFRKSRPPEHLTRFLYEIDRGGFGGGGVNVGRYKGGECRYLGSGSL